MSKWANKLWQCATCSDLLSYTEIHQQASVGSLLCKDCFEVFGDGNPQIQPRLCDECGEGIAYSTLEEATDWSGAGARVDVCVSCSVELPPDEEDEAIMGLMRILTETDSKNATGIEDD